MFKTPSIWPNLAQKRRLLKWTPILKFWEIEIFIFSPLDDSTRGRGRRRRKASGQPERLRRAGPKHRNVTINNHATSRHFLKIFPPTIWHQNKYNEKWICFAKVSKRCVVLQSKKNIDLKSAAGYKYHLSNEVQLCPLPVGRIQMPKKQKFMSELKKYNICVFRWQRILRKKWKLLVA